jgi:hypothetical protein
MYIVENFKLNWGGGGLDCNWKSKERGGSWGKDKE